MFRTRLGKNVVQLTVALTLIMPLAGIAKTYYFWTGAVSTDAADPANWASDAPGTLPTGIDDDVALIGVNSSWQLEVQANQPVLSSEWRNKNVDPNAGWWIINGVGDQSSLTIDDGAYILFTHNDCNLRNGATLRVKGRNRFGGPSLVIPPKFRLGHQGNDTDNYGDSTSILLIEDDGYLRFDPSVAVKGSGGSQIYIGGQIKARIDIRDEGILEIVKGPHSDDPGIVTPQLVFDSSNPDLNKMVISGKGQLIFTETETVSLVNGSETSLQDLIDMGLIVSGEEGIDLVIVEEDDTTIVKLYGQRVSDPSPMNDTPDTDQNLMLSWTASSLTDTYDVYFGTHFDEVAHASRINPMDVLMSMGQTEVSYPADDVLSLEHGQTYYWRVDEIDVPPSQTLMQGQVWSFTVEPYAVPIAVESIGVTASSQSVDQGPEKAIDRSGLDDNDLHSATSTEMWLSDAEDPNSAWIEFVFDKPYKLHDMLVWNYNGAAMLSGLGLKEVTIDYSTDGIDQLSLGQFTLGQAPGAAGYAANTTVTFGDIAVQSVKITAHSNWAGNPIFNKYGLSEVQFRHVPVAAREPEPGSGVTDVALDATLSWRAGREAVEHTLYIDTDEQAVIDGTAATITLEDAEYSPSLELGTTYYWRVDEVNTAAVPSTWMGHTWSFSTIEAIVLDDFESYGNDSPYYPFQTWQDGLGYNPDEYFPEGYEGNGSGSMIGHDIWGGDANNVMELEIIYNGGFSMPLYYDNSSKDYSQIDLPLSPAQDWTQYGISSLTVHVYGTTGNSGQLYVKIDDTKIPYSGSIDAEEWITWEIDLGTSGASLTRVETLSIGIDGNNAEGLIYLDDVLLK